MPLHPLSTPAPVPALRDLPNIPGFPAIPEAYLRSPLLPVVVGVALLCAGRKLFWLFLCAIGFFAAWRLASEYLGEEHRDWLLVGSLIAGVVGAILAFAVQKVAISISGAIAGAYLLDLFFRSALPEYPPHGWVFLGIAAVVGALLMAVLFEWTLILLSALAGAHLICQTLPLEHRIVAVIYVVLVFLGIFIQGRSRRRATA